MLKFIYREVQYQELDFTESQLINILNYFHQCSKLWGNLKPILKVLLKILSIKDI